jgi:uncharacterized protein (TIGR02284 family)
MNDMKNENTRLNELLSYCRSAQKGYETAAEQVDDPVLTALFKKYSSQHGEFAYELEQQLLIQGEDPSKAANIVAGAHRIWINIKGVLTAKNPHSIVAECLRGQRESADFYQETLDSFTFSNDIRLLLTNQMKKVTAMRDDLENRLKEHN